MMRPVSTFRSDLPCIRGTRPGTRQGTGSNTLQEHPGQAKSCNPQASIVCLYHLPTCPAASTTHPWDSAQTVNLPVLLINLLTQITENRSHTSRSLCKMIPFPSIPYFPPGNVLAPVPLAVPAKPQQLLGVLLADHRCGAFCHSGLLNA